ncbi:MAG: hypothetical protein NHB14_25200 [Desulfosporosinus sp.]|nr:hypothetical protein [Desulfosporosinus sp.]
MDREHEHIPEASDTSGWEIAADAVVVPVAVDLQEYGCMYGPKFARKAIGFPADSSNWGKRQADFCAGHTGGFEGEAGD